MIGPQPSALAILFLIWLATVLAGAFHLGWQWRRSLRLRRDSLPLADNLPGSLCSQLGIPKVPALRESGHISGPVLVGILRPTVIVPVGVESASLKMMLAHELAHLKRRDLLWGWLPAICHALFFFHPLLWLTRREWLLTQEMACDELALRHSSTSPASFANMLIDLAAAPVLRPRFGRIGIFETTDNLKRRILAMKITGNRSSRGLMLALCMISVTGILPWRMVAQDRPEDAAERIEQLEKDNASLRQELERIKNTAKPDRRVQLKIDLLENRMQREIAIANLNVASNKLKRAQKLFEDKVESPEVLDIARADVAKLQATIATRDKSIAEREAALAELGADQSEPRNFSGEDIRLRETARLAQPTEAEIAAAEADLDKLRARYTDNHPSVVEAQKRLQKLKARQGVMEEAGAAENKRKAQERELFLEELKLAQKYAESVQKQMEVGRGTLEELVRAQRQVFAIQREIAKLNADHAQLRQVVQEEMKAVQRLLNEARKRVEIGAASPGQDLDLQREMLKLKRDLLQLEEP